MAKKRTTKRKVTRKKKKKQKLDSTQKIALALLITTLVGVGIALFINLRSSFSSEPETFESDKYFVKGIDLSHHNPILNWEMIREHNITFAYLKSTEGNSLLDRNYKYNYERAREANIKVGTYHFFSFGVLGKEQFEHFKNTAQCQSGDLYPAIDVEHSPANPYSKDKSYIALIVSELKELENAMYNHYGVHPVIYTNRNCYKLYIKGNFPDNIIWMCDLDKEPADKINWRIWQFSHKGEFPGYPGEKFDLNYYRYSFDEFKELLLP